MAKPNSIIWFRKGLRLHDNAALLAAAEGAAHVHPIFIIDPWFMQPERVGVNRVRFLLDSLADLDASLRRLNSRLLVLQGTPQDVLPRLCAQVTRLCFEADTEPYAKTRDAAVAAAAAASGVTVHSPTSHTLYDPALLARKNGGAPPLTYQAFCKLLDKVGPPPAPLDAPSSLPPPRPDAATQVTWKAEGGIPTLAELGYPEPEHPRRMTGGETAGLALLENSVARKAWVASFDKPSTAPTAFDPISTTGLSPYMKFGCVSARQFYSRVVPIYRSTPGSTKPPTSLEGQVLWREFFYTVGSNTPNFDRMQGNAMCRQIPWDDTPELLAAWEEGRTGYPWIDAAMTQLRTEGWLHHLARHAVACFLTRGDLWQSWEAGARVFDRYLLDADWALNNGNWMWLSASAFFHQYFRVYGPVSFGKKTDPEGKYIRHYLPVLKDMPKKFIYEPWKAPLDVQRKAKCVIGTDYPRPVVDHDVIHKENIAKMAAAYNAGKEGAAPKQKPAKKQKV